MEPFPDIVVGDLNTGAVQVHRVCCQRCPDKIMRPGTSDRDAGALCKECDKG
jgi:hypothetical protein